MQEAVEKIKKEEGCQAVVDGVVIDVSDDASIKAGVKEVESKLQGAALDVLVVSLLTGVNRILCGDLRLFVSAEQRRYSSRQID